MNRIVEVTEDLLDYRGLARKILRVQEMGLSRITKSVKDSVLVSSMAWEIECVVNGDHVDVGMVTHQDPVSSLGTSEYLNLRVQREDQLLIKMLYRFSTFVHSIQLDESINEWGVQAIVSELWRLGHVTDKLVVARADVSRWIEAITDFNPCHNQAMNDDGFHGNFSNINLDSEAIGMDVVPKGHAYACAAPDKLGVLLLRPSIIKGDQIISSFGLALIDPKAVARLEIR